MRAVAGFLGLLFFLLGCNNSIHDEIHHVPYVSDSKIKVDGVLDDSLWMNASNINMFQDFFDSSQWHYKTDVFLAYDDSNLYIAAHLENDDIKAEFTKRDSKIYLEHCFEFFLDPGCDGLIYYEFEVNALGTVWDLKLKSSQRSELIKPSNVSDWHIESSHFEVFVDGTLNESTDKDKSWSFELILPWDYISEGKPIEGEIWKANFMRVDYDKNKPSIYAWHITGTESIHVPEKWGSIMF